MASKLALEATSKGTCYATADADAFSDGELTIHRFNQKLKYISFSAPSDLGVFGDTGNFPSSIQQEDRHPGKEALHIHREFNGHGANDTNALKQGNPVESLGDVM